MKSDAGQRDGPVLMAAVALLLLAHLATSLWPALFRVDQDFGNLYVAARILGEGRPLDRIYERDSFLAAARPFPELGLVAFVPHPPANAVLLWPLARLAPRAAKAIWTLLLAAALAGSFIVTRRVVALSAWKLAFVFLLPTAALANTLAYGQPYPLLLLFFCLSFLALVKGRPLTAGLLLAPTVVLKLYGLPFLAYLLWTRRWKAAAGLGLGVLLLTVGSVLLLGLPVHRAFVEEVLPWALRGEIQDPYSPVWGSLTSLSYRLFRLERDLNPHPLADLPGLAALLARAAPVAVLSAAIGASRPLDPARLPREWATVMIASLAASPLGATYHFVLLALPVGLLWAAEARAWGPRVFVLLGLYGVAVSSAPHQAFRWLDLWGGVLGYMRLYCLLGLLVFALAAVATRRLLLGAVVLGLLAGAAQLPGAPEPPWSRIEAARGYLGAMPVDCGEEQGWVSVRGGRLVVETSRGGQLFDAHSASPHPRCEHGRVALGIQEERSDLDHREGITVEVDHVDETLRLTRGGGSPQALAHGRFRRPQVSPDLEWVAVESWERGSWDVRAFSLASGEARLVAGGPSNELEPRWTAAGDAILFASDLRRGLGSTAIYRAAFPR